MLGWPVRTFESTVPPGKLRLALGALRVRRLDHIVVARRQRGGDTSYPRAGTTTQRSPGSSRPEIRHGRRRLPDQRHWRAALAEAGDYPLVDSSRVNDIAAIRTRFGDHAGVLVETVLLRRRAQTKLAGLAGLSHWLFTDEALQQATAVQVARHRARRLAGRVCMTPPVRWEPNWQLCGRPPRMWSAATSTKSGWPWRGTIWASAGQTAAGGRRSGGSIAVPCGRAEARQPRRGGGTGSGPPVGRKPAVRSAWLHSTDGSSDRGLPGQGLGGEVRPGIDFEAVRRLDSTVKSRSRHIRVRYARRACGRPSCPIREFAAGQPC